MIRIYLLFICLFASLTTAHAAITTVTPGPGNLETEIAAATDGDTLLLETGDYQMLNNVTLSKGLTFRPADATQQPLVNMNGKYIWINAPSGPVTFQGLTFQGGGNGSFTTTNTKALYFLENDFSNVSLTLSSVGSGFPCYIIGNTGDFVGAKTANFDTECYAAGNDFVGLWTFTVNSTYFVGNRVSLSATSTYPMDFTSAYVIGNEFEWDLDAKPLVTSTNYYLLRTLNSTAWPLYANNTFKVVGGLGSAPGTNIKSMTAIWIYYHARLHNNVIDFGEFDWPTDGQVGMLRVRQDSIIQSNILVNGSDNSMNALWFINETERLESDVSHNICYNNAAHCGTTDGNLTSNPQFIDSVDYVLDDGYPSPAIDAGPVNAHLRDLDGTTNDMGIHGGPHPISQYKAQRAPGNTAPFVYPVFEDTQTLAGAQINVSAIGVARVK